MKRTSLIRDPYLRCPRPAKKMSVLDEWGQPGNKRWITIFTSSMYNNLHSRRAKYIRGKRYVYYILARSLFDSESFLFFSKYVLAKGNKWSRILRNSRARASDCFLRYRRSRVCSNVLRWKLESVFYSLLHYFRILKVSLTYSLLTRRRSTRKRLFLATLYFRLSFFFLAFAFPYFEN